MAVAVSARSPLRPPRRALEPLIEFVLVRLAEIGKVRLLTESPSPSEQLIYTCHHRDSQRGHYCTDGGRYREPALRPEKEPRAGTMENTGASPTTTQHPSPIASGRALEPRLFSINSAATCYEHADATVAVICGSGSPEG
jgi:hypothetical protein